MQGKKSFGTSGHSTHIQTAWGLSGWTLRSATRHTLLQTTKLNSAQTKFILSHIEKLLFKWTRLSLKPLGLQSRLLLWIFMTWTIKESYFQSILGLQAYPEELLPASEWCSWLGEESQANTSPIAHMAQWVTQDTAWSSPAAAGAPFIRCSGFPSTASSVLLPNKRYKFHSEKHSWLYSFYPHLHWRSS